MDRIKKEKENHRAKKVRRPIHGFQAILVEAFSLSRESGQHFSDNSFFCFFSSYILFFFTPPPFLLHLFLLSLFLLLFLIHFFSIHFPPVFLSPLDGPFSLNQPVRNTGTASLSISISQGTNKQTDSLYTSIYSRISLLLATANRTVSFLLKPTMNEVSNTRLYLGNLPRNGMLAHPSTTTTITTVVA